MTYDERMAERVRAILAGRKGLSERKMFGGLAFLFDGKMCVGVLKDELVVRAGAAQNAAALKKPHTRPMDFTGKPMKTMVYVSPDGHSTDESLRRWVAEAVEFASTLPAK